MKRRSGYYVGGIKAPLFASADWDRLLNALIHSELDAEYSSSDKALDRPDTFYVCRRDHKMLVAAEINMLYWFFAGVMAAHQIKPTTQTGG